MVRHLPVYPLSTDTTPGTFSMASSAHQKHPMAKIASSSRSATERRGTPTAAANKAVINTNDARLLLVLAMVTVFPSTVVTRNRDKARGWQFQVQALPS